MNITVFCSSRSSLAPEWEREARRLGEWMAENGHTLWFGGYDLGLMGVLAETVSKRGGRVCGVTVEALSSKRAASRFTTDEVATASLGERIHTLVSRADRIVAFPGGYGTIDEIFTTVVEGVIGGEESRRRVIAFNIGGFWNPLRAWLKTLAQQGVIGADYDQRVAFADSFEELTALLS